MARVAVDFDGVLYSMLGGWRNGALDAPPVKGAAAAMQRLRDAGHYILIHTVRAHSRPDIGYIQQSGEVIDYLMRHGIPFDEIWLGPGKPIADMYLDDRAFRFRGNWETEIEEVLALL